MVTLKELEKFTEYLTNAYSAPLPSIRQHRVKRLKQMFPEFFDFTISISLTFPNIKLYPTFNYRQDFNFEKDFGEILYYVLNDIDTLFKILKNKNYYVQKYFSIILSHNFTTKFTEDTLYLLLDHLYKKSEILSYLELPDILSTDIVSLQSISREEPEYLSFPIVLANVPLYKNRNKLVYLVKNGNKIISNISSTVIRQTIIKNIQHLTYGVIGVLVKEKGYKRKYKFEIVMFNKDYKYIVDYYRGKAEHYDNQIDFMQIKQQENLKKAKLLNMNKEEFISFLRKHLRKKQYLALLPKGLLKLSPHIEYKNVKILDYWYDEDYNLQGLIVDVYSQPYKIKFNIYNTNYVYGIEDKYVRVTINKIKNEIVNVVYCGEVKQWSKQYIECQICKSIEHKHYSQGICYKCYKRLIDTCGKLSGYHEEKCEAEFQMYTDTFEVIADGKTIKFKPLPYTQLSLPLFEIAPCKKN